MKINTLIIIMFLAFTGLKAQNIPKFTVDDASKTVVYSEVVNETGTAEILYRKAIDWVNSFYEHPQTVTKIRDQVDGKIECLVRFPLYDEANGQKTVAGQVEYTLQIFLKDNKYKYFITGIHPKFGSVKEINGWIVSRSGKTDQYLIQCDKYFGNLIAKLKEKMKQAQVKSNNGF